MYLATRMLVNQSAGPFRADQGGKQMLVRWRPMNEVMNVHNEIDRVFGSMLRNLSDEPGTEGAWSPAVDFKEDETAFTLVAELPGVNKDEVKLSLTDNVLSIRGEKKSEAEHEGGNWHRIERIYGRFERHFRLGTPVDAKAIQAKFTDGVLRVTLPKSEEAKPREIQIEI
jgi:HSP20 family protein